MTFNGEDEEIISYDLVEKPHPNEHACSFFDEGRFDRFTRKNCHKKHQDRCIDYVFGWKGDKSEVQSLRYKTSVWGKGTGPARKHCLAAGGNFHAAGKDELDKRELDEIVTGIQAKLDEDVIDLSQITKGEVREMIEEILSHERDEHILDIDPDVAIKLTLANGTEESLTKRELKTLIADTIKGELGILD